MQQWYFESLSVLHMNKTQKPIQRYEICHMLIKLIPKAWIPGNGCKCSILVKLTFIVSKINNFAYLFFLFNSKLVPLITVHCSFIPSYPFTVLPFCHSFNLYIVCEFYLQKLLIKNGDLVGDSEEEVQLQKFWRWLDHILLKLT